MRRVSVEGAEKLRNRVAQLLFNCGLAYARRVGRDVGLQLAQLVGDVLTDDIGAQAEHLAELDEGRAEFCESVP